MKIPLFKHFIFLFFLLVSMNCFSANDNAHHFSDVQVSVNITQPPSPMLANDQAYLVYEAYLTNFSKVPMKLIGLDILGNDPTNRISSFDENALKNMIHTPGSIEQASQTTVLQPGMQKVLLLWLPFENVSQVPDEIHHQFKFQTIDDKQTTAILPLAIMPVMATPPVIVGAPLRGAHWVAANGPSNTSIHRITSRVGNGKVYFAQRFAIDFVQVGEDGRTYSGDQYKNESYHAYGADIYAVAAGKVVAVKNDIPQNVPGDTRAVEMTIETVGGNHVIIEIGYHRYAFYAHMQPGSVKVKVGDMVKAGQILGKLGNSGNTTEPHLHLHIIDEPGFIYGNGVPYAFDKFFMQSSRKVPGDDIQVFATSSELKKVNNQLMLENALVKFEDDKTNHKQSR